MKQTLEQKAEESRLRFEQQYKETLQAHGYYLYSHLSYVGMEFPGNCIVMPKPEERDNFCIVAHLTPVFDTALIDLDYMKRFTIKPEFEGLKVYVEGSDRKKKKEDPFTL